METTNFSLLPGAVLRGATATYKIVRTLGQGTFGITYLAETTDNASGVQSYVAVKEFFMKAKNSRNGSTVNTGCADNVFDYYKKKFEEEALHIKALKHPNIVKCSETFCANNTVYFVMEYIEGESLAARVARLGRLSEQEALRFTRQIGSALTAMHRNNMLHLDVKPSNIMLRGNEAVLIDFGLSKQYDDNGDAMTQSLISSGTNGYAPMEQFHYHEHDGLPVTLDVHALGATLFFMLTGYEKMRYLPATIDEEGFPRHILETNNVTKRTIDVVEKAMAHHKKNRYQTVEEMLQGLENETSQSVNSDEETSFASANGSESNNGKEDDDDDYDELMEYVDNYDEMNNLPLPKGKDWLAIRKFEDNVVYNINIHFYNVDEDDEEPLWCRCPVSIIAREKESLLSELGGLVVMMFGGKDRKRHSLADPNLYIHYIDVIRMLRKTECLKKGAWENEGTNGDSDHDSVIMFYKRGMREMKRSVADYCGMVDTLLETDELKGLMDAAREKLRKELNN